MAAADTPKSARSASRLELWKRLDALRRKSRLNCKVSYKYPKGENALGQKLRAYLSPAALMLNLFNIYKVLVPITYMP